jgi:hypothetical protein
MNGISTGVRANANGATARILHPGDGWYDRWSSPDGWVSYRRPSRTAIKERSSPRIWMGVEKSLPLERILLFLLAAAAVIGIAYGFSCLVDLVQNWAAFERGAANLI